MNGCTAGIAGVGFVSSGFTFDGPACGADDPERDESESEECDDELESDELEKEVGAETGGAAAPNTIFCGNACAKDALKCFFLFLFFDKRESIARSLFAFDPDWIDSV